MNLHLISVVLLSLFEITTPIKRPPCPTLTLKNGKIRYRQRNRFVKFTCNSGFILAGEKYSTCENGKWDGALPKCVRSSCVKVNTPPNALIYPSHRGGVLNFFCKAGYTLRGSNITYCDGMNWDNKLPTCIETNTQPKLQCDFENEDLCGWNHDIRHDFEWTRKNFKTPSGYLGTGPSYDHTKGVDSDGYYMYIESTFRNENDTARLISPIFDKMNDSDVCFEFYYHMYGSTTGQLRVYLKKESENWNLDPGKAFFWKWGNHGEQWIRNISFIGPIDEEFQIIIEGVRGVGHFSDIAIDDVNIIPNCTLEDTTTERESEFTWEEDDTQSCMNRCDTANSSLPCDCDDYCIDHDRCCADYIATCLLGSELYSSTSEMTLIPESTFSKEYVTTQLHKYASTTTTRKITTPNTTTRKTTIPNTTTRKTTTTPRTTTKTTTIPNTTTRQTTIKTTTTTQKTVIKTPTTPKRTTQKPTTKTTTVPKTTKRKTTTTSKPQATQKSKMSSSTLRNVTIQNVTISTKKIIVPVTIPHKIPIKQSTQYELPTKAPPHPIDEIITVPYVENVDEELKVSLITQNPPKGVLHVNMKADNGIHPNTHIVIIIIVAVTVVLIVIILIIIIVRRYRFIGCRMNKIKTSVSDSQSDVRFLTSDEVLNFNLAYSDD